jgi:glycosyltransferase involved in cell wall biosynthesis
MKHSHTIGVETTAWQNERGYGRHARALLSALFGLDIENKYILITDTLENGELNQHHFPASVEVKTVETSKSAIRAASSSSSRSLLDLWKMSQALSSPDFDLLIFPTIYSYVPVYSHAKKIVFIHDVIAETFPQYTLPTLTSRIFWKAKVLAGRHQADAITTVSEYSRKKLIEHFHLQPEKVFVIGEASDTIFRRLADPILTPVLQNSGIPETGRLIIYVGGFGPHKNVGSLITSFARLAYRKSFEDISLILVGKKQHETFYSEIERLENLAQETGLTDRIHFTGYLPDEELVVLMNRASTLVLPSLMEGFGLPAIEAAACGCPVIATQESPLPGLLGDAGIYINPYQTDDLFFALEKVLGSDELRERMSQSGMKAVKRLSWETSAQQLLNLITHILSGTP